MNVDNTDEMFLQNLKRLRKERGVNTSQLSRLSGISYSSLQNYEKGRTTPSVPQLRLLAKAFGVDFNELIGGYPNNRQVEQELQDIIRDLMIYQMERDGND